MAEKLGKFEHEILELPPRAFARWCAYFRIQIEDEKVASQRAKRPKSKIAGRRR